MANDYFKFKKFTIWQANCAMKVGTDGTLLGAWANGGRRILDVGTGTGLIALMMAQRFENTQIVGVDIDEGAVAQARENVKVSPFVDRITIEKADIGTFESQPFDAIISNPPYFVDALTSPDNQRTLARHTESLTYKTLMQRCWDLLDDDGELSVVIPFDCKSRLESEAVIVGFFKTREWAVKTTARKDARRYLLAFRKHPKELDKNVMVIGDDTYQDLIKDFYL